MFQLMTAFVVLAVFAVVDTTWLGIMGDRLYRPMMGDLLADSFRVGPAVVFYILYAVGLTIFAVLPGLKEGGWKTALIWGALFGLFAYGTYDLTSYAVMRTWSLKLTVIDMAWGVFVSGVCSAAACVLAGRLGRALNLI